MRNVASEKKPGFHGIRGLSMRQLNEIGVDPQARAAHTDSRSTKVYIEDNLKWTRVPAVDMRFQTKINFLYKLLDLANTLFLI